jgi:hypothetical protein
MKMPDPPAVFRRRELLLALLLAPLFTLLFFHFALGDMVYFRDLFNEFYPLKFYLAEQLRRGRLPLWNPYVVMGMPCLAELWTACFYPLNVLFLFLSPLEGFRYYLFLHYPFAGLGVYLWLRDLKLRPAAASLGALTFAFSGYLVAQHCNLIYLISPCYWPWALLGFGRAARRADYRYALAAGLTVTLPFLAGEPQGAALAAGIGIAYALFTTWTEGGFRGASARVRATLKIKSVSLLAVALFFAAGLCMIQLLPAWELSRYSERAGGLSLAQATCWSFYPLRLIELLWPNLWGLPWPENHFWGGFMTDWCFPLPWTLGLYLGLWPLLAAAFALSRSVSGFKLTGAGFKPVTLFLAILSLLALLLALGRYTPFYTIAYYAIPGLRLFRYPEKYLALFSLGIAGLAGLGTHQFLKSDPPGRRFRSLTRILLASLIALALAAWLGQDAMVRWLEDFLRQPRVGQIRAVDAADALLGALLRTGAAALGLLLLLELGRLRTGARKYLPLLLPLLTGLDLYTANRPLVPTAPAGIFTRPSLGAEMIRRHQTDPGEKFRIFRDQRLDYTFNPPAAGLLPVQLLLWVWQRDTLSPNWNVALGVEQMSGYSPAAPAGINRLWKQGMTFDMVRSFNIKYALVTYDWSMFDIYPEAKALEFDQADNFRLLRFEGYFPRAYLVPAARAVATEAEAVARLQHLNLKREVVLITTDPLPPQAEGGTFIPARVKSYEPERVVLEVQTDHAGWLVLADTYFPGWEAWVNDRPAKIYRANYLARAVRVEAGQSRIVFVYRPRSYRWGRAITLATIGLALAGIILTGRTRRRNRA